MSVELEVRLGAETVPLASLLASITAELKKRIVHRSDASWPTWESTPNAPQRLGGETAVFRLTMSKDAAIEVRSYRIGAESDLGEDGGWWISLSAAVRSPETLYLILLTAACLAKLSKNRVLDDALFLKQGRWIEPDALLAMIDTTEAASFEQAAAQLKSSL